MQVLLDETIATLSSSDPGLRRADLHIAVLDLTHDPPRLAEHNGESPVYPASVVKFVYLMAAYAL